MPKFKLTDTKAVSFCDRPQSSSEDSQASAKVNFVDDKAPQSKSALTRTTERVTVLTGGTLTSPTRVEPLIKRT